jgi:serine/threonine protein kinase
MSGHDPTRIVGASHADDTDLARTTDPAGDATRTAGADPAGATRSASDPIGGCADTGKLHDSSLTDDFRAAPTDSPPRTSSSAEPPLAAATGPVPGYELLEPLGEGGMGVVWKARHLTLNRLVAVKMVLGDQRAGSKELIRFLAEAEAVAAVKHPHVVQVYD